MRLSQIGWKIPLKLNIQRKREYIVCLCVEKIMTQQVFILIRMLSGGLNTFLKKCAILSDPFYRENFLLLQKKFPSAFANTPPLRITFLMIHLLTPTKQYGILLYTHFTTYESDNLLPTPFFIRYSVMSNLVIEFYKLWTFWK